MDNYITVKTFAYPHELAIAQGRLQSEGIQCYLKDEMTLQVNPFYSNAIGGVKLQVKESDLERARAILIDGGFIPDKDTGIGNIYDNLDKLTSWLPLINKLRLEYRLVIIVVVLVSTFATIIYYANQSTTFEKLTQNYWCVDVIMFGEKSFQPGTDAYLKITGLGVCDESIHFNKNGAIVLPGFNSRPAFGNWKLKKKDSLLLMQADTFDFVYNGIYKIDFSDRELILRSAKTIIYCYREGN